MTSNLSVAIKDRLYYTLGKRPETASSHDIYMALCYAIRDRMIDYHLAPDICSVEKKVAYLSAEFLIGPQLGNNLLNLGVYKEAEEAVCEQNEKVQIEQAMTDNKKKKPIITVIFNQIYTTIITSFFHLKMR